MTDTPDSDNACDKGAKKGILKHGNSKSQSDKDKEMKWDEMNILATYHPADKDYGHQKIDEPPTPYNRCSDEEEDDQQSVGEAGGVDPHGLADSLRKGNKPKALARPESSGDDEEDDEFLTEEEKEKRRKFKEHRKQHYNEFQSVKLARQLLAAGDEDEDDDGCSVTPASTQSSDDCRGEQNDSCHL